MYSRVRYVDGCILQVLRDDAGDKCIICISSGEAIDGKIGRKTSGFAADLSGGSRNLSKTLKARAGYSPWQAGPRCGRRSEGLIITRP